MLLKIGELAKRAGQRCRVRLYSGSLAAVAKGA